MSKNLGEEMREVFQVIGTWKCETGRVCYIRNQTTLGFPDSVNLETE